MGRKMKIIIIPGVGYQTDVDKHNYLGEEIKKKINTDYEVFNWNHDSVPANLTNQFTDVKKRMDKQLPDEKALAYNSLRRYIAEAILDFQYAIKYGSTIEIPEADYYIGHSAGSLFAIAQNKPATIMGSPYALVKYGPKDFMDDNGFLAQISLNTNPILNLINEYDVLAHPIYEGMFLNKFFRGSWLNPFTYFPLTAHTSYWESKFVIKSISDHFSMTLNV